ncbi:hypothetical protein ACE10Z_28630 [Bradyrhizobium sp. Pha-3]|uniref:hypothetical protein n=1 Tax=Bradyrhizobium sp. Pha-3 TaxID=208375 RepID=UPI0035D4242C
MFLARADAPVNRSSLLRQVRVGSAHNPEGLGGLLQGEIAREGELHETTMKIRIGEDRAPWENKCSSATNRKRRIAVLVLAVLVLTKPSAP